MAIAGAIAFMAMGFLIPVLYRTYFDKTEYYTLVQPVEVQAGEHKACERVTMVMRRTATINTVGTFTYEVSRLQGEGSTPVAHYRVDDVVISKGQETLYKPITIPCDAEPGTYYISGIVEYYIDRTPKTYNFYTYEFEVK